MTNLPAILRPETGGLKLPANPLKVLGIDLGTTNSTVAEIAWNPEGVVAGPAPDGAAGDHGVGRHHVFPGPPQ
jgi:hypothetical protein